MRMTDAYINTVIKDVPLSVEAIINIIIIQF